MYQGKLGKNNNRILSWIDPNKPSNRVQYNYIEGNYTPCLSDASDTLVFHFSMDGHYIPADGEEAKDQVSFSYY